MITTQRTSLFIGLSILLINCFTIGCSNNEPIPDEQIAPTTSHMYILSIGTRGGGFQLENKEKSNKWSLLKWAKTIPEIMMDGSIDTVAFQMKEIHGTLKPEDPGSYLRIDTPKDDRKYASDMSDASPENINNLIKVGDKTLEYAKANGLDKFLDGLLD